MVMVMTMTFAKSDNMGKEGHFFAKSDNMGEEGHLYIKSVRGLGSTWAVLGNDSRHHPSFYSCYNLHCHHHQHDHHDHDHDHHLDADQLVVIPMQERERPQLHN